MAPIFSSFQKFAIDRIDLSHPGMRQENIPTYREAIDFALSSHLEQSLGAVESLGHVNVAIRNKNNYDDRPRLYSTFNIGDTVFLPIYRYEETIETTDGSGLQERVRKYDVRANFAHLRSDKVSPPLSLPTLYDYDLTFSLYIKTGEKVAGTDSPEGATRKNFRFFDVPSPSAFIKK
jgi:hypothetical protein